MTFKEEEPKEFDPKRPGKVSAQLLDFYVRARRGENIVFTTPDGTLYSPAAHKASLDEQKARILSELETLRTAEMERTAQGRATFTTPPSPTL